MRKKLRLLLLLAALAAMLSIAAYADETVTSADPTIPGVYALTKESSITLTPMTESSEAAITPTAVTISNAAVTDFYANAVRVKVSYSSATSGSYYLVLAKNSTSTPTADNIGYIDQSTAGSTTVDFTVYPSKLVSGQTYYIYLSSNDSTITTLTQVASFKYYAPYTLGDVNGDGTIDVADATMVLNHIVKNITLTGNDFLAADVTNDGTIDVSDAAKLLNFIVKNITTLN
jgi:uncharacterized protein (DUF2141 family)